MGGSRWRARPTLRPRTSSSKSALVPMCGFPTSLTPVCLCSNCLADGVELQKKHKPVTVSYQGYTVVNGVMFVCWCVCVLCVHNYSSTLTLNPSLICTCGTSGRKQHRLQRRRQQHLHLRHEWMGFYFVRPACDDNYSTSQHIIAYGKDDHIMETWA